MEREHLLQVIRDSLLAITEPRLYENERGFQGQLLVELAIRLKPIEPPVHFIVEQEHQKTLEYHGLALRPDIVLHQPFDPTRHRNRREGNFAVIELKRRAGPARASEDFLSLAQMLNALAYPLGIFINVDHDRPHADHAPPELGGSVVAFAVRLHHGKVRLVEEAV